MDEVLKGTDGELCFRRDSVCKFHVLKWFNALKVEDRSVYSGERGLSI